MSRKMVVPHIVADSPGCLFGIVISCERLNQPLRNARRHGNPCLFRRLAPHEVTPGAPPRTPRYLCFVPSYPVAWLFLPKGLFCFNITRYYYFLVIPFQDLPELTEDSECQLSSVWICGEYMSCKDRRLLCATGKHSNSMRTRLSWGPLTSPHIILSITAILEFLQKSIFRTHSTWTCIRAQDTQLAPARNRRRADCFPRFMEP
jgi:hypothetical protein